MKLTSDLAGSTGSPIGMVCDRQRHRHRSARGLARAIPQSVSAGRPIQPVIPRTSSTTPIIIPAAATSPSRRPPVRMTAEMAFMCCTGSGSP